MNQVTRFLEILDAFYSMELQVTITSEFDTGWHFDVAHPAIYANKLVQTEHANYVYDLVPYMEECLGAIRQKG